MQGELSRGRVIGPIPIQIELSVQLGTGFQFNRMGVVPKSYTMGKWRLVMDLSFPEGMSINDGIEPTFRLLHYTAC